MQVGTICYTTCQGIAHLARDFHKHGVINRVYTVNHPHYKSYPERYPVRYDRSLLNQFVDGLDVLLLFETYLDARTLEMCRRAGVKIVLMPMCEYTPHPFPSQVDLCLCPSSLDLEIYQDYYLCEQVTVPVEREWSLRTKAERFIHNAGHGQYQYAKGTPELLEAMKHVKSDIVLKVKAQPGDKMERLRDKFPDSDRIQWLFGDLPDDQLYVDGDVFVYPEKFNGLSLPLQEAWASGLMVMTTHRTPSSDWLPIEPSLPVMSTSRKSISGGSGFELVWSQCSPLEIAATMDRWYRSDISAFSFAGQEWAQENSWDVWKPKYLELLEDLL